MTILRTGFVSAPNVMVAKTQVASNRTPGIVPGGVDVPRLPIKDGIYRISAFEQFDDLIYGISTRCTPDGEDWNLSARRGTPQYPPSLETAQVNRRKFAATLDIPIERVVGCQQVHGAEVALVGHSASGKQASPVPDVDALITDKPRVYLMALAADCPSVFFYDPVRRAIGLAHSGWKGTVAGISANVVQSMVDNFGSSPTDIVAGVGPGIGPCCYEVGANVIEAVETAFQVGTGERLKLLEKRNGKTYFSLRETIRYTLLNAGVRSENITVEEVCTAHNTRSFYSHRAESGHCGLFGAILGLK